jgi:putative acetyltransferase
VRVRPEEARDRERVSAVVAAAFGRPEEARLVEALRVGDGVRISLVAEQAGEVVGHVFFSPVTVDGRATPPASGMAPVSVAPDQQRRGIGGALVRAGLDACRRAGIAAVFVLGHPAYYRRFGFAPAGPRGLRYPMAGSEEAFMALELSPGALDRVHGLVAYDPGFGKL